jgi:hypothetical protein
MTGNEWGGAHLSCTGTLGNEYKVFIIRPERKEPFASFKGIGLEVRKRGCVASASLGARVVCLQVRSPTNSG